MQFEEEGPKEYVDISRAPDEEMRPDRPVPAGCGQGTRRAEQCLRRRRRCDPGAGRARRIESTCLCAPPRSHPRKRGPCSSLRRAGCVVALLDHIDIWPSSGALHPLRPGRNATRVYI